jgi:hypothetical protein
MIKSLTIIFFLLAVLPASAQFKPQIIASSGNYFSSGQLEVSYTVGEMTAVTTVGSTAGVHLTQGFHQPEEVALLTALREQQADDLNFALYPNPTTQTVWVGYQMRLQGKVTLGVYSLSGQLVQNLFTGQYTGGSSLDHFDISALATGNYLLTLQYASNTSQPCISSKQFSIIH